MPDRSARSPLSTGARVRTGWKRKNLSPIQLLPLGLFPIRTHPTTTSPLKLIQVHLFHGFFAVFLWILVLYGAFNLYTYKPDFFQLIVKARVRPKCTRGDLGTNKWKYLCLVCTSGKHSLKVMGSAAHLRVVALVHKCDLKRSSRTPRPLSVWLYSG